VRRLRPRTIVIVTADHGEAFGEHNSQYHGTTLYEEQVRVPMIISAPWLFGESRVHAAVQTIDLWPTVGALVSQPVATRVRGRDLRPLLTSGIEFAGVAFASLRDTELLAVGTERLICNNAIRSCALFDLGDDPLQLAPKLSGPRVDELRAALAAARAGNDMR
jgi:phosphoglycerol transferase MdoB-like AlkP superfamily enzyme